MIYDCTTKYEPQDRHLNWQETIHLSGVSDELFKRLIRTLTYCTVFVNKFFRELGFKLWDIKWEAAVDKERIIVVDTIDPDSIRITGTVEYGDRRCFVHFNKQAVRDYYRIVHKNWYDSLNETKKLAETDSQGRDFLKIYKEGVREGRYPEIPQYDEKFSRLQSQKYSIMVSPLLDKEPVSDVTERVRGIMNEEIDFYRDMGKLDKYLDANSVSN